MDDGLSFSSISKAARILKDVAEITPVIGSRQLDAMMGGHAFLKCENFQRSGSFKFRGAYHAVAHEQSQGTKIVATISSGNHGHGLALSANLLGLTAHVIMPKPVTWLKHNAILNLGAQLELADHRLSAEERLRHVVEQTGATSIHAFNDPRVMAGQGTILLEFFNQVSRIDVLLAPVGGGGLLSGLCVAGHHLQPALRIFACEPEGALDVQRSLELNRIVPMKAPQTIADGLRTSLGSRTLPVLREHLEGVLAVSEKEIRLAMQFAFEALKIVIEPSSAVALAPLLRAQPELIGHRVGVIVTGGNVDLKGLRSLLEEE